MRLHIFFSTTSRHSGTRARSESNSLDDMWSMMISSKKAYEMFGCSTHNRANVEIIHFSFFSLLSCSSLECENKSFQLLLKWRLQKSCSTCVDSSICVHSQAFFFVVVAQHKWRARTSHQLAAVDSQSSATRLFACNRKTISAQVAGNINI